MYNEENINEVECLYLNTNPSFTSSIRQIGDGDQKIDYSVDFEEKSKRIVVKHCKYSSNGKNIETEIGGAIQPQGVGRSCHSSYNSISSLKGINSKKSWTASNSNQDVFDNTIKCKINSTEQTEGTEKIEPINNKFCEIEDDQNCKISGSLKSGIEILFPHKEDIRTKSKSQNRSSEMQKNDTSTLSPRERMSLKNIQCDTTLKLITNEKNHKVSKNVETSKSLENLSCKDTESDLSTIVLQSEIGSENSEQSLFYKSTPILVTANSRNESSESESPKELEASKNNKKFTKKQTIPKMIRNKFRVLISLFHQASNKSTQTKNKIVNNTIYFNKVASEVGTQTKNAQTTNLHGFTKIEENLNKDYSSINVRHFSNMKEKSAKDIVNLNKKKPELQCKETSNIVNVSNREVAQKNETQQYIEEIRNLIKLEVHQNRQRFEQIINEIGRQKKEMKEIRDLLHFSSISYQNFSNK